MKISWRWFKRLFQRALSLQEANERRIRALRSRGVKIGEDCLIYTANFSTEPYLIEIGNRVGIAGGTQFVTHEGGVWLLRKEHPDAQIFGRITVGDDTMIGMNCIILPGTHIGSDCVVGAGSVVRDEIPDGSVVVGNPAQVVGKTSRLRSFYEKSPHRFDSLQMSAEERERLLKKHFGIS